MQIDKALADRHLLGAGIGSLDTWQSWLTVLKAAYGAPLLEDEEEFFQSIAGAREPPQSPVSELWYVAGVVASPAWRRL